MILVIVFATRSSISVLVAVPVLMRLPVVPFTPAPDSKKALTVVIPVNVAHAAREIPKLVEPATLPLVANRLSATHGILMVPVPAIDEDAPIMVMVHVEAAIPPVKLIVPSDAIAVPVPVCNITK